MRVNDGVDSSENGEGGTPPPLSHYCALGFPSSLFSLKPPEFRFKLNFHSPPLLVAYKCDRQLSKACTYMLDAYICIVQKSKDCDS